MNKVVRDEPEVVKYCRRLGAVTCSKIGDSSLWSALKR